MEEMFLLNTIMEIVRGKVTVFQKIFQEHHIISARAADQRYRAARSNYGVCLTKGEGRSIDFKGPAYYFKLAADQGFVAAQYNHGICLEKGEGVRIDFTGAAHYYKLAADQGNADA
jgi:TPR repeat protein